MKRVINLLIFICAVQNVFCQTASLIDSLLTEVQLEKVTISLTEKALLLPYDKIVNDLNKSQVIFESIKKKKILNKDLIKSGDLNEKLALVYYLKGNYAGSSSLHQESITLFEKAGDDRRKAIVMATQAYESKRRNLKESIRTMSEAVQILKKLDAKYDLASALDNFGVLFELNGDLDTAMFYYNEALKLKTEIKDSVGIPYSLNNIAGIHFLKDHIPEGIKFINQSTEIRNRLHDYIGMAWNEYSIGELYLAQNRSAEAKKHFQKSYSLSLKAAYPDLESRNLKHLSGIFANNKQYDSAYFYFNSFFDIHDSLYNETTQKQLLEMETLYKSEKKSSQIKELNNENKLKETELESKRSSQKFLLFILALSVIAGVFIFKAYRQKNKANKIIQEQKTIVEHQKHIVEEHQKEILDSIHYAKRIQNTLLAHKDFVNEHIGENFIFFKPKDIVSGDFYWAAKHGHNFYLAVCDSTGHGVPGAFMSLLNINFLNEAINEKDILEPNKVLDFVRERLIKSISKDGQKDGFDGILLRINEETKEITYAAANNPPILVSDELISVLEADRMPVGQGERSESFSLFTINAKEGDTLYLYTDGYADQFGGPKGKKFKYKPLNELLLSGVNMPLENQKMALDEHFQSWRGGLEQVDDVCIIGIKL